MNFFFVPKKNGFASGKDIRKSEGFFASLRYAQKCRMSQIFDEEVLSYQLSVLTVLRLATFFVIRNF